MLRKMKRYLHDDSPIPRRTAYRRRKEALIAARLHVSTQSRDSETESEHCDSQTEDENGNGNSSFGRQLPVPFPIENEETDMDGNLSDGHSTTSLIDVGSRSEASQCGESDHDSQSGHEIYENISNDEGNELLYEDGGRGLASPPPLHEDMPREANHFRGVPLCPCTTTTEGDTFLMCLALGIRHGLSWVALVDILKFVNKLFGRKVVHDSKYFLLKHLDHDKNVITVHMYCHACENYLGTKEKVNEEQIVQCNNCEENVKPFAKNSSYFVSVKTDKQFQALMEKPDVAQEIMTYRFERCKLNNDAYEDIYDGHMYKKLCEPGEPLSVPKNVSVTINTDGLALGESSTQSAWPIFMHINELSPQTRKKHMIYAGMWVGQKQPNMNIFLRPFVNDLIKLIDDGFAWKDSNGVEQCSKVIPILAVLDSGARYKFLNLTSFLGYMGCTFCYQRAENTQHGRRFTVCKEPAALRTQESMLVDMRIAHERRNNRNAKERVYRGCKGLTPLVYLHPHLNLGSGVVVDFMHNALLGVTRAHIYALLNTAGAPYYLGDPEKTYVMNQRLMQIRPPRSITRTPRELTHIKKYTAGEWRAFLLFYSIACLDGHLNGKYFEHFALLSASFYILLKGSITGNELELAHGYLRKYVFLTQQHFGETAMRYNFHLLLHVTKAVSDWGPIWAYSTFVFEGENHFLNKMHTSSGRVAIQLTRRYLTFKVYPNLCESLASSDEPLLFIRDITGKRYSYHVQCNESILIGKSTIHHLSAEDLECLRILGIDFLEETVYSFSRVLHRKVRLTTKDYSEGKKNDDSWVKTRNDRRGFINSIYHFLSRERSYIVIMLQEVTIDRAPILQTQLLTVNHIKRILDKGSLIAIKPSDIIGQCIHMETDTGNFIADIPYGCYGD